MLKNYLPKQVLKKDFNESELYAELYNGSIIQVRGADNYDSIRGNDYYGCVIDEWALCKVELWEEILRPVLTENGGWSWFLFTPKGRNHAFKYWNKSKEWGDNWANFFLNVNDSNIISKEELDIARREMPEMLYRQEFLCEFLEGEGSVFRGISKCIAGKLEDPFVGGRYIIGVDLAKTEDYTVLTCIDQFTKRVVAWDRFNDVSWRLQKERICAMAKKYNDALLIVDSTGLGDPIVEDLENSGCNVEGFHFSANSKKSLIERLILSIEQRLILFPSISDLISELESFSYEITSSGFKYTSPSGIHDDCVISLALAVHGLQGFLYSSTDSGLNINFDKQFAGGRAGY